MADAQMSVPLVCGGMPWQLGAVVTTRRDEFESFFLANYDEVLRVLTALTGDRERAVDATQEAFIKAHGRWSKIRQYESPAGWVRRVAIHASRDSFRSERRRRRRERAHEHAELHHAGDDVDGLAAVQTLLAPLTPRQREVASLFYVDDRSISDIAVILDLTEGTVKFHLSEARDNLRRSLQQERTEA